MRNLSRGTRALVLLAFAATAALTGPGAAGAQGPLPAGDVGLPVLAEQLRFRAELGLPADAALVRDLNASWADGRLPGAHTEGAVFTAEEARELDAREEAGREIAVAARAYFPAEAPTHLAGIHIDHASGNTVVSVTRDAGRHLAALRARTRHGDRIAMRVVRFGLVDLERAARTVVDQASGGDVWTSVGVNEFDHRVDVDLLADTPANRARVLAVLTADDAPMVRFFQGARPSFLGTSERNAPPSRAVRRSRRTTLRPGRSSPAPRRSTPTGARGPTPTSP